jgi:hypothetical protein
LAETAVPLRPAASAAGASVVAQMQDSLKIEHVLSLAGREHDERRQRVLPLNGVMAERGTG